MHWILLHSLDMAWQISQRFQGFCTCAHHRVWADVTWSVLVFTPSSRGFLTDVLEQIPVLAPKELQILPLDISISLWLFFFFNACLNSSRKAFNFPQGKFHVANLFSAVRLTNTKTHFMLLFGKVHDIYVNTVFVTKA